MMLMMIVVMMPVVHTGMIPEGLGRLSEKTEQLVS